MVRYFTKQNPFDCGSRVFQSEDQKSFPLQHCQFRGFIEVKLSMLPNKEVFKFLTILCLFGDFLLRCIIQS